MSSLHQINSKCFATVSKLKEEEGVVMDQLAQTAAASVQRWSPKFTKTPTRVGVSRRSHVTNRRVECGRQASLISHDVQHTTAALQKSWCLLHHGSSAHVRVSWVSRQLHVVSEHLLLTSSLIPIESNTVIIIIIIIITCYLSTPFIILQIHNANHVMFTNFLNAHPLTRPHPLAVWRKFIIISNCRLIPYWREFLGVSWSPTRSDLPFANT